MEQTATIISNTASQLENSLSSPLILKDAMILSPGTWTGEDGKPTRFTGEQIRNGFMNVQHKDLNLFLDHKDTKGSAVGSWIGFVKNMRMDGDDLKGDVEIWHPMLKTFIKEAKAKFAISATMDGVEKYNPVEDVYDYQINSFRSMSLVDEPGCETAWLPRAMSSGDNNTKTISCGEISKKEIKELASPSEIESESDLKNCKEVKTMAEEVPKKEKTAEDTKELAVSEEAPKEEAKNRSFDEVKELGAKVDALANSLSKMAEGISALTGIVQKSFAAPEESEESEDSEEEVDADKELEKAKLELEETKKELSSMKEKLNAPNPKTLASSNGGASENFDANQGMINFFRELRGINY